MSRSLESLRKSQATSAKSDGVEGARKFVMQVSDKIGCNRDDRLECDHQSVHLPYGRRFQSLGSSPGSWMTR